MAMAILQPSRWRDEMAAVRKLVIGRRAPDFTLPATGGTAVRLSEYRGRRQVVLAFYCLDWTPG